MKKELIIGAAAGYDLNKIRPFLYTLAKTDFKGDVVLLVDKSFDYGKLGFNYNYNIKEIYLFQFNSLFPSFIVQKRFALFLRPLILFFVNGIHKIASKAKVEKFNIKLLKIFGSVAMSRYAYYYEYIQRNKELYTEILLTDIRDVIFQKNPFPLKFSGIGFALENTELNIKDEPINSKWIKTLFDDKVFNQLSHNHISCSGTTLGTISSVLQYLKLMIYYQSKIIYKVAGMLNFDQGVHNYIVWGNFIKNKKLIFNEEGEIYSMVTTPTDSINIDKNGYVLDLNNNIISILHQYDWHSNLKFKVINDIA